MESTNELLLQKVPNAIGTLSFDENKNIVTVTGIGSKRVADIDIISQVELNSEGFGLLKADNLRCNVYKQDGNTVVIYQDMSK